MADAPHRPVDAAPAGSAVRRGAWGASGAIFALMAAPIAALPACNPIFGRSFVQGTYAGDVPCALRVLDPSGTVAGEDDFTILIALTVEADGGFRSDGVELAVGEQVLRSIPTADLAFEVTAIHRAASVLTVEYAPRPALPGVSVRGTLTETYRQGAGAVQAAWVAELEITDVSSTTVLIIECKGPLPAG